MSNSKHYLKEIIRNKALERREVGYFTLASGQESDYYIDMKQVLLRQVGLKLCSSVICDYLYNQIRTRTEFVAGVPIGGTILASGICVTAHHYHELTLHQILVRKESKTHGTQNRVESAFRVMKGKIVVVIEDVTTTGKSSVDTANLIHEHTGIKPTEIITIVDRSEGAEELVNEAGYKFHPIFRIKRDEEIKELIALTY